MMAKGIKKLGCRLINVMVGLLVLAFTSANGHAADLALLFEDDFSLSAVGEPPKRWSVSAEAGYLRVVEDAGAVDGKAVRMSGNPRRSTSMSVTLPTEDPIVIVDYSLRWVKGSGLNYFLDYAHRSFGRTNLNWYPDQDGNLIYRYTGVERRATETRVVGQLNTGWNRLRIVADLEQREAYIFLNDTPGVGPLPFWYAVDHWSQIRLTFHDHGNWLGSSSATETETYYDDVKIWSVPGDHVATYRQELGGQAFAAVWLEFADVARRPMDWWRTAEARALGERIIRHIQSGRIHIDVPVQLLTVPDGIHSTQLMALAQLYAATGEQQYKVTFIEGMETLLEAQFPSGLWPTVYPDDKDYDMLKDKYAEASWDSIPALFNSIIEGRSPFHTDIAERFDPTRLREAIDRVPPRNMITRYFEVADYARYPASWWTSEEARRIGDNLLTWQMEHGGWERIQGMAYMPFSPELGHVFRGSPFGDGVERGDFLGGRTTEPMRFLARLYDATGDERYLKAFNRGLDFVLAAQYPSGGWPRYYPMVGNNPQLNPFNNAVTFYTDAMVITMGFLQDVMSGNFPFGFVDDSYKRRLHTAFEKGIDYILQAQIVVDGRPTAWGQRHDPINYRPVQGRAFEIVAINPWVSVGIIQLLQSIPDSSAEVRRAILYALEYLEMVQLSDGQWAMFYEIGTNRPIFAGSDGIVRYRMEEIDLARQLKYPWYGNWPEHLLMEVKRSGALDALYERLPDHPVVRVRFTSVSDGDRVHGTVPIDVELLHAHHAEHLEHVTIDLDGDTIYRGQTFPDTGQLLVDSEKLPDGRRALTVTTVHSELGTFSQTITLDVQNWWRLVQNMAPPTSGGWFGTVDYLQTDRRSDGWGYDVGRSAIFFDDPQRLIRVTDQSEYLVWKTPRLQTVSVTVFIRPDVDLKSGLELATSPDGQEWTVVDYSPEVDGTRQEWSRATIAVDFSDGPDQHWLRLILTDAIAKEDVQIGDVVMAGFSH